MNRRSVAVAVCDGLRTRRWLVGVLGLAALTLAALLAPGTTESAGTGSYLAPAVVQMAISYDGACNAGNLGTKIQAADVITGVQTKDISVSGGTIAGCIGTATDPGTIKIDSELFDYANINTTTTAAVLASTPTSSNADIVVNSTTGFPASGQIFVGSELLTYGSRTSTTFDITSPGTFVQTHPSGSFVRLQNQLRLVARGQPTSSPGAGVGATTPAKHNTGTPVADPMTFLTCRGRISQTKVTNGNDIVAMRYRCYMRLQPASAWPDLEYTTSPDAPSTGPVMGLTGPIMPLTPNLYHGTASGNIADAAGGLMTLNTEVFGLSCFPLVQGQLWIKNTQVINVDVTPLDDDSGTFTTYAYTNDQCSGMSTFALGNDPGNVTFTEVSATTDTDEDGCTDLVELGPSESLGGKRDPFNPFDHMDVNHDGAVNVVVDILQVAAAFGTGSPRYVDYKNRGLRAPAADPAAPGALAGPSTWNKTAPTNENINVVDDILGVAAQFGHNCPHATHNASPFGAHPTTVATAVSSGQTAPFTMSVSAIQGTLGFPNSGTLLVDAETLTYDSKTAASFHITVRGTPALHTISAIVYQKTP